MFSDAFKSEEDYILSMESQSEITFYKTNDMTYKFTATTFTKTSRLPIKTQRLDGTPFVWFRSWYADQESSPFSALVTTDRNHERVTNEAKALEIISKCTKIPVPRLLDHGSLPDGRRYLTTEFIDGINLSAFLNRSCSKPERQKHTNDTPCKHCSDEAHSNALMFIAGTVSPQLATLQSYSRGIDGFVMPPSWLSPDVQPPWKGKEYWKTLPSKLPEYVFQHGDLSPYNIIMDPQTLKVKALIDWEYAGYYPPGMENWPGTLCLATYNTRARNVAHLIQQFLATEYLECYEKWGDKAQLDELITSGKLPHPAVVRQEGIRD